MMTSSLGRQTMPDGLPSPRDEFASQMAANPSARFARTLPQSAAAQAIFGNTAPNHQQPGQFPERPVPQRLDSQPDAEGGFRYNVHSPGSHHPAPTYDQSHSRSSSANERNINAGNRKRQPSSTGLNDTRPGSRHRSALSIGGVGGSAGDESSSSSRRGSGPGRKRAGKDKEGSSRGQSTTPSGLRDSLSGSMGDSAFIKMADLRDSSAEEEISTIFIVGFPDDITEREFANMFLFAPGFEASSLKYPTSPSLFSNHNANRSTKDFLTALTQGTTDVPPGLQQQVIAKHGTNPVALLTELMALHEKYSKIRDTEGETPTFEPMEMANMDSYYPAHLQQGSTANSSTTSLIGMSMTGKPPPRRQTIGFAKFRTRADAVNARDLLQGRKMDAFYNAVLKVELAKKNLHTKRMPTSSSLGGPSAGLNDDMMIEFLLKSGKASQAINSLSQPPAAMPSAVPALGGSSSLSRGPEQGADRQGNYPLMTQGWTGNAYDMPPPPVPGYVRSNANYEPTTMPMPIQEAMSSVMVVPPSEQAATGSATTFEPFRDDWATYHHNNYDAPVEASMSELSLQPVPSATGSLGFSYGNHSGTSLRTIPSNQSNSLEHGMDAFMPTSPQRPTVLSPAVSHRHRDSKALLALAEEADEAEGWTVGGIKMEALGSMDGDSRDQSPVAPTNFSSQAQPPSDVVYGFTSPRMQEAALSSDASAAGSRGSLSQQSSYQGIAPIHGRPSLDYPQSINVADQNPPINTLYVGNLPSSLGHTHSANYLEDSLRNLFCRVSGFKRMSFRQKANGPMCFVEFEDVPTATLAMKDLYGHTLGGLIKGGLRLSYSKNSLGQRTNPKQPPPSLSQASLLTSGYTSPSSWGPRSPLSPTSASSNGFSFTPAYPTPPQGTFEMPNPRRSNSFINNETPLSPLAAPFATSFPMSSASNALSPRLQHMPISADETRQGKDGAFSPILPRASVAVPWKMSSMAELDFTTESDFNGASTGMMTHTGRTLARSQ